MLKHSSVIIFSLQLTIVYIRFSFYLYIMFSIISASGGVQVRQHSHTLAKSNRRSKLCVTHVTHAAIGLQQVQIPYLIPLLLNEGLEPDSYGLSLTQYDNSC